MVGFGKLSFGVILLGWGKKKRNPQENIRESLFENDIQNQLWSFVHIYGMLFSIIALRVSCKLVLIQNNTASQDPISIPTILQVMVLSVMLRRSES